MRSQKSLVKNVEINRIEFSKSTFNTKEAVESYLVENAYEQFAVEDAEDTWVVLGQDAEKFEDVQPIEYEDGVLYFIGKLKEVEEIETPAAEVVASEEFSQEKVETAEAEATEVTEEVTEEVVAESDEPVAEATTHEEIESKEQAPERAEGQEGFSAEDEIEPEEKIEEVETFSVESLKVYFEEKLEAYKQEITSLKEELELFKQKQEETVDENQIIVQHSQAVNSDEIIKVEEQQKDEKAVKFSQNRTNDLFGLRG
jgi:hypothetical protein